MTDQTRRPLTYKEAGVDTAEGARAVERIREAVRSTYRPEVIGDIGGFGGLFSAAAFKDMDDPVMVSGTDGVGTKLKLAQLLDQHDTVGIDLVAMCANDILVSGAEPLFFLDYVAVGRLESDRMSAIVGGIAEGCRQAGCALIGGEMAEHPGTMDADDYDLSGFCVGVVDRPKMITGEKVRLGDVVLGLSSSGLHSNGFSLVRRAVVEGHENELDLPRVDLGGASLGAALLEPTRLYVKSVLELLNDGTDVHAMAHITGGGITENLDRVLPDGCDALIHRDSWPVPSVIKAVVEAAALSADDAYRTFNMGVGFALVLDPREAPAAAVALRASGETVWEIGEIIAGNGVVCYR
ncbi:MAG: phosphoribosylformylglycinamidine cyclo-ligase [Actinobacteria bacterium HGW-Actinobacteria-7]|jgi:phosphoribosylformylglycinamidine cyclo-ligase|nr:MAG: phosphoribosylformylglycinamidine cyclo-ligase [Actinobacteria bacterium HGW-Actinobacteria-7]